jgi:hypothetical protein
METETDNTSISEMMMRDWFAAQAINATVTAELVDPAGPDFEYAARRAYAIADAMLKARAK